MNFYVVVEGESELTFYPTWLRYFNKNLTQIFEIDQFENNNFFIVSGGGFPQYLHHVANGVHDFNQYNAIDRFIVIVDSEDLEPEDARVEVENVIKKNEIRSDQYFIVTQVKCAEAWCLGNRASFPSSNIDLGLRKYVDHFNVYLNDPEQMIKPYDFELSNAQYAESYLRALSRTRHDRATYQKHRTDFVHGEKFIAQLIKRYKETGHLVNIESLIRAFT